MFSTRVLVAARNQFSSCRENEVGEPKHPIQVGHIQYRILLIRGEKVIIDADLAEFYGVPTKRLNEQVKRNSDRFPDDFAFTLEDEEWKEIRRLRSQNATLKRGRHRKYLPRVFTEHGALMAANVLNSPQAVEMSVFVVRAFVRMRTIFSHSAELAGRLSSLEAELRARVDTHDAAIVDILRRLLDIIDPPRLPEPKRKKIGFGLIAEPYLRRLEEYER